MTYCLAWKKENKLFFIADSALSTDDMNRQVGNFTSFGELEEIYENDYVYEGKNKITVINDKVVVCFSGIVSQAYAMIDVLKDGISCGLDVLDAIRVMKDSTDCSNVSLIIGYIENNQANLLRFDDESILEGDYFDIGSGSDVYDWSTSVKKWFDFKFPIEHLLQIMVSIIQVDSMSKHMFRKGFGATYTGIQLGSNGVKWCDDLSYMIYTPDQNSLGFISVINRKELIATQSTFNSVTKLIPGHKHSGLTAGIIIERMGEEISKQLQDAETEYLVLTNVFRKKVVVMYIDKCLHNKLFRMWRRNREKETDYLLVFDDTISDYLFTSKFGDDEEMTMHFLDIHTLKDEYISLEDFERWSGGQGNIANPEQYY